MVSGVTAGMEKLDKDMIRRCSHCGHNGHNSRTCPDRGFKLFGVRLTEGLMRKSASMGNLSHYGGGSNNQCSGTPEHSDTGAVAEGYVSDGLVQTSTNTRDRKKGLDTIAATLTPLHPRILGNVYGVKLVKIEYI